MSYLIIEGNPKSIRNSRFDIGGTAYSDRFLALLDYLQHHGSHDVAFPADIDASLPSVEKMSQYRGIIITGSSLNAYQDIPSVTRQLDFVSSAFDTGVPIYGSCWGMQLASMVAGGVVEKSLSGREFGVTESIELTELGKKSRFYQGKPEVFSSLCTHEDEVSVYASNTEILAKNSHSKAQAMTIHYKKSSFFGVQYHPEFLPKDMLVITRALSKVLFNQNNMMDDLSPFEQAFIQLLPKTITDYSIHSLEIKNWLDSL
jgi:GMP synthase - Glutamine amidotransferase domain